MTNPVDHLCGGETRPFLLNNMFLKLFGRITLFDEIVFEELISSKKEKKKREVF